MTPVNRAKFTEFLTTLKWDMQSADIQNFVGAVVDHFEMCNAFTTPRTWLESFKELHPGFDLPNIKLRNTAIELYLFLKGNTRI